MSKLLQFFARGIFESFSIQQESNSRTYSFTQKRDKGALLETKEQNISRGDKKTWHYACHCNKNTYQNTKKHRQLRMFFKKMQEKLFHRLNQCFAGAETGAFKMSYGFFSLVGYSYMI